MNKWKKFDRWARVRAWVDSKMKAAWMQGGNCDSRCPICRRQESLGNIIETRENPDGSETRLCTTCKYSWQALFTPAGFVSISDSSAVFDEARRYRWLRDNKHLDTWQNDNSPVTHSANIDNSIDNAITDRNRKHYRLQQ